MEKYRVLIVDDKLDCLNMAKAIINNRPYKGRMIQIVTSHIRVEKSNNDCYRIKKESITEIAQLSTQPFDLLLLDFGYIEKGVVLKDLTLDEFEKRVLNPSILVNQGLEYLKKEADENLCKCFYDNFVSFSKNICIYTFVSEDNRKNFPIGGDIEGYCFNKAKDAFEHAANITVKDTRKEIFNGPLFEEIKTNKEEYYNFILNQYLELLIFLDIADKEIDAVNKKYKEAIKQKENIVISELKIFVGSSSDGFKYAQAVKSVIEKENSNYTVDVWKDVFGEDNFTNIEVLETALEKYRYSIFIFSPDDTIKISQKGDEQKMPRDNVEYVASK